MHDDVTVELTKYIAALNKANPVDDEGKIPFDMAWRWVGSDTEPWIEVYEECENHVLCYGTREDIIDTLRESLDDWLLEDVVHYV